MADQPDPPERPDDAPEPPDEWRVYSDDQTPEPEPPSEPPPVPYGNTPPVPYGAAGQADFNPVYVTAKSSAAPKLVLLVVALAVLGGVVAGAIAIFSAVDGGIGGLGGIDAKDPEDFAELVEKVEEQTGSTEVFWVGLYDGYIIVDVPYSDDETDNREISYRWDGGDLEEWNKTTSTDQRFDLAEIDPDVIEGMCDPVLDRADGATPGDCYVFISAPQEFSPNGEWFRASATDEFGQSYSVQYDKSGVEVARTP